MSQRNQMLRDYVLEATSNDYENLDEIVNQVTKWLSDRDQSVGKGEILIAIGHAIREGYAQAYFLSPERVQPVDFSCERIDELWFYVTPKGMELVKSLAAHDARQ